MPSIRERVTDFFLGKEKAKLQEATSLLFQAYQEGPYLMTPDVLLAKLKEVDSSLLQDYINSMGYDLIGGYSTSDVDSDAERNRAIDESRRMYKVDPVTWWVVQLWTNFGFGETISIKPQDKKAQETWTEFWEADRNSALLAEDALQFMSEDLLVDGEKFLLFFISTLDGECTLREMDTKEVVQIITHPDDKGTILFYKRTYTTPGGSVQELYYPDWMAYLTGALEGEVVDPITTKSTPIVEKVLPRGAKRADMLPGKEKTIVLCMHLAHNRKGGVRGWPLMTAAAPWSRAHKKFREDRVSVAASVAMFVRKIKVQGGSRAVNQMRQQFTSALSASNSLETNPPPVAGSTFVENQAADLSSLNLGSGAGDAKSDGESLLLMAGLGGGVYPHWMGAGDAYRLATASSMESPMYREFSRYQKFWSAQFRRMVRIVLWAAETYGSKTFAEDAAKKIDVSTDKLLQTDLTQLVGGLTSAMNGLMSPFQEKLPPDTLKQILQSAWVLVLQTLGVANVEELTSDKAFSIGVEIKPPEPVAIPGAPGSNPSEPKQEGSSKAEPGQPVGKVEAPVKTAAAEAALGIIRELREAMGMIQENNDGHGDL